MNNLPSAVDVASGLDLQGHLDVDRSYGAVRSTGFDSGTEVVAVVVHSLDA